MDTHYSVNGERFDNLNDATDAATMHARATRCSYTDIYQVDTIAGRRLSQPIAYADERGTITFDTGC